MNTEQTTGDPVKAEVVKAGPGDDVEPDPEAQSGAGKATADASTPGEERTADPDPGGADGAAGDDEDDEDDDEGAGSVGDDAGEPGSPTDADAAEAGPAEVGPAEVGPAEVGPAEVGPAEVGPAEAVAGDVDLEGGEEGGEPGGGDEREARDLSGETSEGTPPSTSPRPDPADEARRRLARSLLPRATRSQLLAAVVCALLGFGLVVQARQAQVADLASLRESELVAVLDNVSQQSARLDAQARSLQETLDQLRTSSDRAPAARQAAEERLRVLGVLAGTLPATGPGIVLEVADPRLSVNATELLETVQELRDAGAEAMQIGSVRVVASTALVDDPRGMLIDNTVVSPPYRLLAVGDPQTLAAALEIPGGVLETLRGKGVEGVVTTMQSLTITALRQPRTPQYARPAQAP